MKKTLLYSVLVFGSIGVLSFNPELTSLKIGYHSIDDMPFSNNSPAAKTGAPGEGSCVDCHNGSTLPADGVVTFTFSGTNNVYLPGQSYDITIGKSGSVKTGFQMTALDGTNSAAGSFTAGSNSQTQINGGRNYINHSASSGVDTWTFQWNAPSSGVGDVSFYYALNETNNNNNNLGDQIYLGSSMISEDVGVSVEEKELVIEMKAINNQLMSSFVLNKESNVYFAAQDLTGKQLDYHNYGLMGAGIQSLTIPLSNKYSAGVYLFTIFIDNTPHTTKIALP